MYSSNNEICQYIHSCNLKFMSLYITFYEYINNMMTYCKIMYVYIVRLPSIQSNYCQNVRRMYHARVTLDSKLHKDSIISAVSNVISIIISTRVILSRSDSFLCRINLAFFSVNMSKLQAITILSRWRDMNIFYPYLQQ